MHNLSDIFRSSARQLKNPRTLALTALFVAMNLTLDLLKQYADRVYVQVPEGETVPTVEGLEIVPIVTQGTDTGSWALLS